MPDRPPPSVARLASPLVISFWTRAGFALVDTAYAATLGDAAVAAIGLTAPFELLIVAAWTGLTNGLTAAIGRSVAACAPGRVGQYVRAGRLLILLLSALFVAAGGAILLLAPRLPLPEEVRSAFRTYGSVLVAGSALTAFWSALPAAVVKAHQDTRTVMWAGILANLVNIALNTVFTFGLRWGLGGIALATVLGKLAGLAWIARVARRHRTARVALGGPAADPAPVRTILTLAVPGALGFVLMGAEAGVVNAVLAVGSGGAEAIAAFAVYSRVLLFALQPIIALAVALLPYAARCVGAGDAAGLREGTRQAATLAIVYAAAIVVPAMALAAPLAADVLAGSACARGNVLAALRFAPIACLASAPLLLARPVFEALGRGGPGLTLAALRHVVLTVPAVWVGLGLARTLGARPLAGVLGALIAAAAVSSVLAIVWLRAALRPAQRPAAASG